MRSNRMREIREAVRRAETEQHISKSKRNIQLYVLRIDVHFLLLWTLVTIFQLCLMLFAVSQLGYANIFLWLILLWDLFFFLFYAGEIIQGTIRLAKDKNEIQ